ncbi:MAG: PIG-L family deacetylase [Rhodothermales bacterium]
MSLIVAVLVVWCLQPVRAQVGDVSDKVLLAVFAHPDDESTVAPVLARYAREGANVVLVTATDGRLGTNEYSDLPAGDELAAVRRGEMECAASALGVELIHLDYYDQFNSQEGYDGFMPQLQGVIRDIHRIIEERTPDAIVTFGPDGFSNHMDHRLVGSSVTQALVSTEWETTPALYFVGMPASQFSDEERILRGVQEKYLTVRVPYTDEDGRAAIESLRCHTSQFPPDFVERRAAREAETENLIYFRPFTAPTGQSGDLFAPPSP